MAEHEERMARVEVALRGLSVGDAFGERFFVPPGTASAWISERRVPEGPWRYTDDTEMALAIRSVLAAHRKIDRDALAAAFATRYRDNPYRGYGATAQELLQRMFDGEPWELVSKSCFGGEGSMGNGAAMRAAPVGAYFAGEVGQIIEQGRASAEPTHAHPDGQAGAIAVALAAGWAATHAGELDGRALLSHVLEHTPASATRRGLEAALALGFDYGPELAASRLGSGSKVISSDTVPFALWCSARRLDSFTETLWTTVAGLGDRDTTCAISGGICALAGAPIPPEWISRREALV
jgi:ADP-ribosylglycohydrolase